MLSHAKKDKGGHSKGEPQVISEKLIREQIKIYNEENKIWNQDNIHFSLLSHLHLSFQNISVISNLEGFERLQQLKLNYNSLEKISGINHLTELRWLDLSFNYIKEIQGIDNLLNLTDLSLEHNQIADISGLPVTLKELDILSIGTNPIQSVDPVIQHLRKFKNLQCVNVAGCAFATHNSDYKRNLRGALAPMLKYLNYEFIDDEMRKKDKEELEKGTSALQFEEVDTENEEKLLAAKQLEIKQRKAMVFKLNKFCPSILEYPDIKKLLSVLPTQMSDIITRYLVDEQEEENVLGIIKSLQANTVEKNDKKQWIINDFSEALKDRFLEAEKITIKALADFKDKKDKVFNNIDGTLSPQNEKELNWLEEQITTLNDELMQIELDMTQSIEDMFETQFKVDLKKQTEEIVEQIQESFNQIGEELGKMDDQIQKKIEDMNTLYQRQLELEYQRENGLDSEEEDESQSKMDRDTQDVIEGQLSQEAMNWLEEGDEVQQLLSQLSERLGQVHSTASTSLMKDFNVDQKHILQLFKDRTYTRNRQNINNIIKYLTKYKEEIAEMRERDEEDSSDG